MSPGGTPGLPSGLVGREVRLWDHPNNILIKALNIYPYLCLTTKRAHADPSPPGPTLPPFSPNFSIATPSAFLLVACCTQQRGQVRIAERRQDSRALPPAGNLCQFV
jgi:hypothetical protein